MCWEGGKQEKRSDGRNQTSVQNKDLAHFTRNIYRHYFLLKIVSKASMIMIIKYTFLDDQIN